MKTASVTFNADGTMTLVCGRKNKHFDSLSQLVSYCQYNGISVCETHTIQ